MKNVHKPVSMSPPYLLLPGGLARISQTFQEQMAMLLFVSDENDSWYIDINIQHANLVPTQSQTLEDLKKDEGFRVRTTVALSHLVTQRQQCALRCPSLSPITEKERELELENFNTQGYVRSMRQMKS